MAITSLTINCILVILIIIIPCNKCYPLGQSNFTDTSFFTNMTIIITENSEKELPRALWIVIVVIILLFLCALFLGSFCFEWCQCKGSVVYSTVDSLPAQPTGNGSGRFREKRASPSASPVVQFGPRKPTSQSLVRLGYSKSSQRKSSLKWKRSASHG